MLDKFHDIIGGIHVPVDDGVDKLNRKYTLLVFLFLALPIFTKQYIGDPIECFAPVYFAEHQSRYINSYCWTQSTYYMVPVGDPDDDGDQQEPPDRITPDELDYFISFETVTHIGNERLRRVRVSYYQWAPLILLAQGLCFYIPFLIWNSCANNAGVKLRRLLKKASDIASLPPGCQQREALLAEFVDQFHTLVMGEAGWCADFQCGGGGAGPSTGNQQNGGGGGLSGNSSANSSASNSSAGSHHANGATSGPTGTVSRRGDDQGGRSNHSSSHHHHQQASGRPGGGRNAPDSAPDQNPGCCLVGIPIIGSLVACCLRPCASFGLVGPSKYLCLLYLAVKFAYVFNVGLQFFLLGKFLGRGYLRHGLELINRVLLNGEWWASPRFPLSTLCQVRADMSGGLRSYTCQCVLPINVFNEKIFSVVWFYMAFLLPLNVLSLLFWIYRTFESNRMSYIRLCLWRTRLVELNQIHRTVRRLSQSYLGWDGVFLLRLIEHNHGSIMATLIMSRLWEFYANQIKLQEDANQIALANSAHNTLANLTSGGTGSSGPQAAITAGPQASSGGAGGHSQSQPQQGHHHHHHHHHPQQQQQHPQLPPPPALQQQQQHHHHHHQQPTQSQQQQQQYLASQHAGGHAHLGHHAHGPATGNHGHHQIGGHGHPMHNFAAGGPHQPLQPTQAGGPGAHPAPPPPPMVPHGPIAGAHGHHSGQVSQAPGHHPLHAANTAAPAHHVHHQALTQAAAVAAAAAAAAAASATNPNSQSSGQPPPAGPHLSGAFTGAHANLLAQLHHQAASNQQQQLGTNSNNNQQPPGNVAAAVAALAAAAAATNNQPTVTAASGIPAGTATTSLGNSQQAPNAIATGANSQQGASTIHLSSLKQQAPGGGGGVGTTPNSNTNQTTTTSNSTNSSGGANTTTTTTTNSASSATTSFITQGGPPLPPPPPAHVVAAVAAAAGSGAGASSQTPPTSQQTRPTTQVNSAPNGRPAVTTNSSTTTATTNATGTNKASQRII